MKIERLIIENFKSIERIELIKPNPFTVFVGPNGSGKSNIFEGLEFFNLTDRVPNAISLFGGKGAVQRRQIPLADLRVEVQTDILVREVIGDVVTKSNELQNVTKKAFTDNYHQLIANFSRLFVKNDSLIKLLFNDDQRLSLSANNLEKVLKRVLSNEALKDELFEWLELFVPSFKAVEVDDRDELHWFEESSSEYFTKDLISDGTYNILALLAAVYQSEKPQFLCIEEPENGLHPEVIMTLVDFFRQQCEEKGHYIWLNTHSESVVKKLTTDEIVLV
ncbi:MAG: AAA family ATPase, partial [Spirosoma sp.]|nr:AAA family ATPase [Spirosoma sp.]